ncbi:conserved hypothetical protein, partial [delta proteobacterium NaphS2]
STSHVCLLLFVTVAENMENEKHVTMLFCEEYEV